MGLIAGIDSSTQSTKVVLHDEQDWTVVGTGSAPHPPTHPPVSEQDPHSWWGALGTALHAALAQAGAAPTVVRALSVAAQCHGLVALDGDGQVVRPAKLWNDTTSAPQMRDLSEQVSDEVWAQRTGSVPTAAFTISKLAWLRQREPAAYARTRTVLLPHDWLTMRLVGRAVTDRSEASGTGYYDATRGEYAHELLALVDPERDWSGALPQVLGPNEPAGHVSAAAARELGLAPSTLVGAGAGDQHASALGLGVRPGDVVYVLGTSGVVFTTTPTPVHDATGTVDGVADAAGGYLPLVSTLNAAKVTDTFARLLGVDHHELSRMALAAGPGGPVLVPYLDGERKPDLPSATGTLAGLTHATTREQIARAAVEGVLLGLLQGRAALAAAGAPTQGRTVVAGGASRSAALRQLLADLTGSEVHTCAAVEAVADGAALQAAAVLVGRDVGDVRDERAAPLVLDSLPRQDTSASADAMDRYQQVASWRGGDRR